MVDSVHNMTKNYDLSFNVNMWLFSVISSTASGLVSYYDLPLGHDNMTSWVNKLDTRFETKHLCFLLCTSPPPPFSLYIYLIQGQQMITKDASAFLNLQSLSPSSYLHFWVLSWEECVESELTFLVSWSECASRSSTREPLIASFLQLCFSMSVYDRREALTRDSGRMEDFFEVLKFLVAKLGEELFCLVGLHYFSCEPPEVWF